MEFWENKYLKTLVGAVITLVFAAIICLAATTIIFVWRPQEEPSVVVTTAAADDSDVSLFFEDVDDFKTSQFSSELLPVLKALIELIHENHGHFAQHGFIVTGDEHIAEIKPEGVPKTTLCSTFTFVVGN
tara:strand:+ start:1750 stop:2139 length:390 start_codon:yes stop_codon:yes gene_type:complete